MQVYQVFFHDTGETLTMSDQYELAIAFEVIANGGRVTIIPV